MSARRFRLAAALLLAVPWLAIADGILDINGPRTQQIYIDGELVGTAPMRVMKIPGGSHEIKTHDTATGADKVFSMVFPEKLSVEKGLDLTAADPLVPPVRVPARSAASPTPAAPDMPAAAAAPGEPGAPPAAGQPEATAPERTVQPDTASDDESEETQEPASPTVVTPPPDTLYPPSAQVVQTPVAQVVPPPAVVEVPQAVYDPSVTFLPADDLDYYAADDCCGANPYWNFFTVYDPICTFIFLRGHHHHHFLSAGTRPWHHGAATLAGSGANGSPAVQPLAGGAPQGTWRHHHGTGPSGGSTPSIGSFASTGGLSSSLTPTIGALSSSAGGTAFPRLQALLHRSQSGSSPAGGSTVIASATAATVGSFLQAAPAAPSITPAAVQGSSGGTASHIWAPHWRSSGGSVSSYTAPAVSYSAPRTIGSYTHAPTSNYTVSQISSAPTYRGWGGGSYASHGYSSAGSSSHTWSGGGYTPHSYGSSGYTSHSYSGGGSSSHSWGGGGGSSHSYGGGGSSHSSGSHSSSSGSGHGSHHR